MVNCVEDMINAFDIEQRDSVRLSLYPIFNDYKTYKYYNVQLLVDVNEDFKQNISIAKVGWVPFVDKNDDFSRSINRLNLILNNYKRDYLRNEKYNKFFLQQFCDASPIGIDQHIHPEDKLYVISGLIDCALAFSEKTETIFLRNIPSNLKLLQTMENHNDLIYEGWKDFSTNKTLQKINKYF